MILQRLFHANGGGDPNRGDEVVTTRVPNPWKRIVFGVERHCASLAVGVLRSEGGAQVVGAPGHVEALVLEEVREDLVRVDFLVS